MHQSLKAILALDHAQWPKGGYMQFIIEDQVQRRQTDSHRADTVITAPDDLALAPASMTGTQWFVWHYCHCEIR